MKAPNETALVRQLLRYLSLLPQVRAWRQNQGVRASDYKGKRSFVRFAGAKGISDIIGIATTSEMTRLGEHLVQVGRFLAVEAKMPGNEPTVDQAAFLGMVREWGGIAVVAYSVEDLQRALSEAGVTR